MAEDVLSYKDNEIYKVQRSVWMGDRILIIRKKG